MLTSGRTRSRRWTDTGWRRIATAIRSAAALGIALAGFAGAQDAGLALMDSPEKAKAAQEACAARLGKPVQWTNSIGMKFQLIPPGEFVMGSASGQADEKPHTVRITQPYYLGTTEVTRAQWEAVTKRPHSNVFPGPDIPIHYICWYDAESFIAGLNKAEKATYRLPTEAEWEYAARAGTATEFYTGNAEADLDKAGWFVKNSRSTLRPVAQKAPNAFGLYDMLGNAWEWCSDFYDKDYYSVSPAADPTGPKLSLYGYRVVRGGSIYFPAASCRSSHRDYYQDSRTDKHFGFRVLLPIAAAPAPAPK